MMLIIPYLITLFTGYLALITLFRNDRPLPTLLFFTLSALTGISITIILTFLSFIFLNRFHLVFIIFAHALIIIPLLWISGKNIALRNMTLNKDTGLELLMAAGSGIISFLYAKAYPMGDGMPGCYGILNQNFCCYPEQDGKSCLIRCYGDSTLIIRSGSLFLTPGHGPLPKIALYSPH